MSADTNDAACHARKRGGVGTDKAVIIQATRFRGARRSHTAVEYWQISNSCSTPAQIFRAWRFACVGALAMPPATRVTL